MCCRYNKCFWVVCTYYSALVILGILSSHVRYLLIVVIILWVLLPSVFFSAICYACIITAIRGDGQHINLPIAEAHQLPDDGGPDQTFAVDMPAFVYETTDDGRGGGGETPCSVCLEVVKGGEMVRKLPVCDHVFHVECIDMWLRTHATCPNCRSRVRPPEEVKMVGVDDSPAQQSAPPV